MQRLQTSFLPWLAFLFFLTLVIFLPMNHIMVFSHPHNDYADHIQFARQLREGRSMPDHIAAHPAWQVKVTAISRLLNIGVENAAFILQTGLELLLAGILLAWLRVSCPDLRPLWGACVTLVLMVAAPLMLPAVWDGLYYLGYIGITSYHNPTIILLRPFAVLIFLYAAGILAGRKFPPWHIPVLAVLVVISALAKPSQLICLLPAMAVLLFWRLRQRQETDWRLVLFGIFVPAVAVLTWQFLATFGGEDGGILLAPLAVMQTYSGMLAVKFFLSIWFPLLITLMYWQQTRNETGMQLAWLNFAFGAGFTYLLAEGGARFQDGNWGWSGEITLFLLFAAAAVFFLQQRAKAGSGWRWWVGLGAGLVPQLVAGIMYYFYVISSGTFV